MGFSKSWIILICVVSVISSVIALIVPKSSSSKAYSYLCAAVMIYTFLLPFMTSQVDFSALSDMLKPDNSVSQSFDENAEKTALTASENGYKTVFLNALAEKDITVIDIVVKCKYKNEQAEIESVTVNGEFSKENKEIISQTIEEAAKEKITIYFSGGDSQ